VSIVKPGVIMPTDKPYQIIVRLKQLLTGTRRTPAKNVLTTNRTAICAVANDKDAATPATIQIESVEDPTTKHVSLAMLWGAIGLRVADILVEEESENSGTDQFIALLIREMTDQMFFYMDNPEAFYAQLQLREALLDLGKDLVSKAADSGKFGSN